MQLGPRLVLLTAPWLAACATSPPPRPAPPASRPVKAAKPKPKRGAYWYVVDNITPIEPAADGSTPPELKLWVALPIDRPGQKVKLGTFSPQPTEILSDEATGTRVAYFRIRKFPDHGPLMVHFDFEIHNSPVTHAIDPAAVQRVKPADHERFVQSEPWIDITDEIARTAREIVGEETNPYRQTALVFDWIVEHITYDYPHVRDRGAKKSFARRKGDCGEFSHVFIAMMRSLGVPARSVTALWYQGGGHAWAEVLLPPYGWVPVDTSGAQLIKNGLKGQMPEQQVAEFVRSRGLPGRDPRWLLGNLYPHRIEVFIGENLTFTAKDGTEQTFRFMQPGGKAAWPPAVRLQGLSSTTVHSGFTLFGKDAGDTETALARAAEELGPAYLQAKLYAKAKEGLRRRLERKPDDCTALFQLGSAHFNLGEYDEAVATLRRSLAARGGSTKRTTDTWAHILIGMAHDAKGERQAALAEYREALAKGADYDGSLATAKRFIAAPFRPDAGAAKSAERK